MEPRELLIDPSDLPAYLYSACVNDKLSEVIEILEKYPGVDPNWADKDWFDFCAFHWATTRGNPHTAALLLAQPSIEVNKKDEIGRTPFYWACSVGIPSVLQVMLKDPRVLINEVDDDGHTPLAEAALKGNLEAIKWLTASGRDLDLGEDGSQMKDAVQIARNNNHSDIADLLEKFVQNPHQTRFQVRLELKYYDEAASEWFALVVFLCDNLLRLRRAEPDESAATRSQSFLSIAHQLPMELQMILCYRAAGSMKNTILGKVSEAAFRNLAQKIRTSHSEFS